MPTDWCTARNTIALHYWTTRYSLLCISAFQTDTNHEIIYQRRTYCSIVQFDSITTWVSMYDMKSDEGSNWVRQGDESESAKIVFKQVKWTFFDAYLWQTMWNHAKKINGRVQTFKLSVFTMGRQELCAENAQKTPKLEKLKRKLLNFLKMYDLYRVVPWESRRPENSENVVVFEIWRF